MKLERSLMIKTLTEDNFEDFKNYCIAHRSDHDESFLYDEDLDEFIIGNKISYNLHG